MIPVAFRPTILFVLLPLGAVFAFAWYVQILQNETADLDELEQFKKALVQTHPNADRFSFQYIGKEDKGYYRKLMFVLIPIQLTEQIDSVPTITLLARGEKLPTGPWRASEPLYRGANFSIFVNP